MYGVVNIHFIQICASALSKSNNVARRSIRKDCLRKDTNVARIVPKFLFENVAKCGLTDNADLIITRNQEVFVIFSRRIERYNNFVVFTKNQEFVHCGHYCMLN